MSGLIKQAVDARNAFTTSLTATAVARDHADVKSGVGYEILIGDCVESMRKLPDASVNMCVTSPPYFGLRNYGVDGQIGMEATPDQYVQKLVEVFREVKRVLRNDGTVWLNLGDSYASYRDGKATPDTTRGASDGTLVPKGMAANRMAATFKGPIVKHKDLIGIPWRVAFALQADGWYLRQDIIWQKPNPMPESVRDRCTKSHEYIFLLTKSPKYYYDHESVKEACSAASVEDFKRRKTMNNKGGGDSSYEGERPDLCRGRDAYMPSDFRRNRRSVWSVQTKPYKGAHFATFPPELIEPCILAGCPPAGKQCDCDDTINTPTGTGDITDDSITVGRAGMARERRLDGGRRVITRREQRSHAEQIRRSPHIDQIREKCGSGFDHYVRTDYSGARPLPQNLIDEFMALGWLVEPDPCTCPASDAGVVLDPFGGSGTTAGVAVKHGRRAIICELNPDYAMLVHDRVVGIVDGFKRKPANKPKFKKDEEGKQ